MCVGSCLVLLLLCRSGYDSTYFFKAHFNNIFQSTPSSFKRSYSFVLSGQNHLSFFPFVQHVLPSVAQPHSKLLSKYLTSANRIEARNHRSQSSSASQSPRYPIQTTVLMISHCGYLKAEPANDNALDSHSRCDTAQAFFFFC